MYIFLSTLFRVLIQTLALMLDLCQSLIVCKAFVFFTDFDKRMFPTENMSRLKTTTKQNSNNKKGRKIQPRLGTFFYFPNVK